MRSTNFGVFDQNAITALKTAYNAALQDIAGRPEWRRAVGSSEIRTLVAKTIMDKARSGSRATDLLSSIAVAAVQATFMAIIDRQARASSTPSRSHRTTGARPLGARKIPASARSCAGR